MSLNIRAIHTLRGEWNNFVQNILMSKSHNIQCKIVQEATFSPKIHTTDKINFEVILKFIDVPCRANQSKCRNIEIFLRSRITYKIISPTDKKIIDYNTAVQYCKKDGKNLNCIMGYHYDGNDITIQYGHPIFHMQFKNNILYDVIHEIEMDKFDVINKTNTNEMDEVRIPTAQMDIYNTIVSLFADHLYTDKEEKTRNNTLVKFNIFLSNMEKEFVRCEIDSTKLFENGPQTPSCYSNRWYPIKIPEEGED